jgi:hypothetical protein
MEMFVAMTQKLLSNIESKTVTNNQNYENYKSNISGQRCFRITDCIQTAFHGYAVMVYDISDDILEKSKLLLKLEILTRLT